MPLIKRFEEIQAWQEARQLTRQIYQLSDAGNFGRDFGLRDQKQNLLVFWELLVVLWLKCNPYFMWLLMLAILTMRPFKSTTPKPPKLKLSLAV